MTTKVLLSIEDGRCVAREIVNTERLPGLVSANVTLAARLGQMFTASTAATGWSLPRCRAPAWRR